MAERRSTAWEIIDKELSKVNGKHHSPLLARTWISPKTANRAPEKVSKGTRAKHTETTRQYRDTATGMAKPKRVPPDSHWAASRTLGPSREWPARWPRGRRGPLLYSRTTPPPSGRRRSSPDGPHLALPSACVCRTPARPWGAVRKSGSGSNSRRRKRARRSGRTAPGPCAGPRGRRPVTPRSPWGRRRSRAAPASAAGPASSCASWTAPASPAWPGTAAGTAGARGGRQGRASRRPLASRSGRTREVYTNKCSGRNPDIGG